jgi:hypothetical protein
VLTQPTISEHSYDEEIEGEDVGLNAACRGYMLGCRNGSLHDEGEVKRLSSVAAMEGRHL